MASLQSQDEAYLLSPLHAASGVDSLSLQSVDDVTLDATEWQKGLLGRMGRFAGEPSDVRKRSKLLDASEGAFSAVVYGRCYA